MQPTPVRTMRLVEAATWLLFVKGLMLVPVTVWTFFRAYRAGEPTPAVGVASCAAGTLAITSACVAAWIRSRLP
jgi:hypothetical protein